jgi:hypothetical protein
MKLLTKLFIFSLLIACPTFALADNTFPSFPMAFWGTATLNGQSLASGTGIQAFCNNSLVGQVTMAEDGIYGYAASTKNKLLVSTCSGDILFEYLPSGATTPLTGSSEIKYTGGFQTGTTINENLAFVNAQSCNITNGTGNQTWSGSAWGDCSVTSCNDTYHQDGNACISNTRSCTITNGNGSQAWTNNAWGDCTLVSCISGYTQSGNTCVVVSSGGGGGGGGGGGVSTPVITPTTTNPVWDSTNVGISDLSIMAAEWGQTGTGLSADLNHDGVVDILDFSVMAANWNGQ